MTAHLHGTALCTSAGREQVTSAGGLGHSPLCPASSGRISSSPGMQRAMGEVCDSVCVRCAQPCSSGSVHVCTTQLTAPRDSDMDVNGLGESQRKAQGRTAEKELVSALGNREWKSSFSQCRYWFLSHRRYLTFVQCTLWSITQMPILKHNVGGITACRDTRQLQCVPGSTYFQTPSHSYLAPLQPRAAGHPPTGAQPLCKPTAGASTSQRAHSLHLEEEKEIFELFTLQLTPVPQIKTVRTANPKSVSLIL